MSGYLDHMLVRAFGRGPVLRPRPRSRFEPAAAGPADLTVWPESRDAMPSATAEPAPAADPAWAPLDPEPGLRDFPTAAPEPSPDGRRVHASSMAGLAKAGPEPSGDEQTADPFGIKELDTERTADEQPRKDPAARSVSQAMAAVTRTDLPAAAGPAGPAMRRPVVRPAVRPEPGDPAPVRRPSPPRAAPVPDQLPRPAPTGLDDPAPVVTAAHSRSARPPSYRAARPAGAADGQSSPVPADPLVRTGPPMTAGPPVLAAAWDVADAPAAAGPADVTGSPPTGLLALAGTVDNVPTDAARRPAHIRDITPAPVVNVTIGRVEVRQPPAPPPPPARSPGPRPLSLDEYLERRNSGPS